MDLMSKGCASLRPTLGSSYLHSKAEAKRSPKRMRAAAGPYLFRFFVHSQSLSLTVTSPGSPRVNNVKWVGLGLARIIIGEFKNPSPGSQDKLFSRNESCRYSCISSTSHKAPPKSLRSQFKQKAVLDFSHRLSQSLNGLTPSGSAVLSGAFDSVKALDDRNREFTWGRLVYIYIYPSMSVCACVWTWSNKTWDCNERLCLGRHS